MEEIAYLLGSHVSACKVGLTNWNSLPCSEQDQRSTWYLLTLILPLETSWCYMETKYTMNVCSVLCNTTTP